MPEEEQVTEESVAPVDNASPEAEADAKTQESEAESTPAAESKDGFGKRIKELTDKVKDGKRTSDATIYELRQQLQAVNDELDTRPKIQDDAKTLDDFEFDETKYRTYLDERTAKISKDAVAVGLTEVQTKIEAGQVEQKFKDREGKFSGTVSDYDEIVYGGKHWKPSDAMAEEVLLSDIGPEMAYHLAKNPEKAAELSNLPPRETVRQMTLLETELKSEMSKTSKSVSDAPSPPPKIPSGSAGLEKKIDDSDLSTEEFAKMRRKQIAKR